MVEEILVEAELGEIPSFLGLETWRYEEYFDPRSEAAKDFTLELEKLVLDARLDEHPFFELAINSRHALDLWVSQELVMTNAFSQLVLRAASQIRNVHVRAILTEIAYGEHGRARGGFAKRAHPWLLERMRMSIGLDRHRVKPQRPTTEFIRRLANRLTEPLEAVAFIGIGNERLIAPEYAAVRRCFQALTPDADFEPFLKANIDEDITHARLCYELGGILVRNDADETIFLDAASASIDSRVKYFDDLLVLAKSIEQDE